MLHVLKLSQKIQKYSGAPERNPGHIETGIWKNAADRFTACSRGIRSRPFSSSSIGTPQFHRTFGSYCPCIESQVSPAQCLIGICQEECTREQKRKEEKEKERKTKSTSRWHSVVLQITLCSSNNSVRALQVSIWTEKIAFGWGELTLCLVDFSLIW